MILRGIKYAAALNVTLLQFGHGTISTMTIDVGEEGGNGTGLAFKQTTAHEIGHDDPSVKGSNTDVVQPEVIIEFTKLESFDVVIEQLQLAKQQFIDKKQAANA